MEVVRTEHDECIALVYYLKTIWCLYGKIASEIWTPSFNQIKRQKAEWLTWWIPDYIIILRCRSWKRKTIFLEMKRKKGWVVSAKQKIWINALTDTWLSAYIANGAMEAIRFIQKQIAEN